MMLVLEAFDRFPLGLMSKSRHLRRKMSCPFALAHVHRPVVRERRPFIQGTRLIFHPAKRLAILTGAACMRSERCGASLERVLAFYFGTIALNVH
jgi:hypothetical protein